MGETFILNALDCLKDDRVMQNTVLFITVSLFASHCLVPVQVLLCVCVGLYVQLGVRQQCCLPRRRMNNKCSLKFGSNVFRLLSRVEAFPRPSRVDASDKIWEEGDGKKGDIVGGWGVLEG